MTFRPRAHGAARSNHRDLVGDDDLGAAVGAGIDAVAGAPAHRGVDAGVAELVEIDRIAGVAGDDQAVLGVQFGVVGHGVDAVGDGPDVPGVEGQKIV